MTNAPRIQPVKKDQASPEIRARFEDIQDTMGVPWPPANWRAYAMYPDVMKLFWERLKPAVATDPFLRDALEITERAYRGASDWYRPGYRPELSADDLRRIEWELDAFEFGNPQLLIQQAALSRALRGETAGQEGGAQPRRQPNAYRGPEISMIDEQQAAEEVKRLYQDIKQTLGLPVVNSDYQALAKWPGFFGPAWSDAKQWRQRNEYRRLQQELGRMADEAAGRLRPAVRLDEREVRDALGEPAEFENLERMVPMFTQLLPGLILNDALFRIAAAGGRPVSAPRPEGAAAPAG